MKCEHNKAHDGLSFATLIQYGLVALCLVGCGKSRQQDSSPSPVIEEANQQVTSIGTHLGLLTNLTTATPPVQVSSSLQAFAAATDDWSGKYIMLRAKMLAKGVGEADEQQIVQRYREVHQQLTTLFARVESSLRGRSDLSNFEPDLQKVQEIIRKLPPG